MANSNDCLGSRHLSCPYMGLCIEPCAELIIESVPQNDVCTRPDQTRPFGSPLVIFIRTSYQTWRPQHSWLMASFHHSSPPLCCAPPPLF
uniref:Uncharacterized protein n=1 Tax=Kalanchoe fedtschenkoi TaxID=63787 RepID=A0A7N0VGD9_KALFE